MCIRDRYGRSKLATLLHAKWLAKHVTSKHPNILANATHPGIVDTEQTNIHIHEAYPLLGYGMSVGLKPFRKSVFEGCVSTMYAATSVEDSGLYSKLRRALHLCPIGLTFPSRTAKDRGTR